MKKKSLKLQIRGKSPRTGAQAHSIALVNNELKNIKELTSELTAKKGLPSIAQLKRVPSIPRVLSIVELDRKVATLKQKVLDKKITKKEALKEIERITEQARKVAEA